MESIDSTYYRSLLSCLNNECRRNAYALPPAHLMLFNLFIYFFIYLFTLGYREKLKIFLTFHCLFNSCSTLLTHITRFCSNFEFLQTIIFFTFYFIFIFYSFFFLIKRKTHISGSFWKHFWCWPVHKSLFSTHTKYSLLITILVRAWLFVINLSICPFQSATSHPTPKQSFPKLVWISVAVKPLFSLKLFAQMNQRDPSENFNLVPILCTGFITIFMYNLLFIMIYEKTKKSDEVPLIFWEKIKWNSWKKRETWRIYSVKK